MSRSIVAALLATATTALAGECTITPELSRTVRALIRPGMLLVHYCKPCGEEGLGPFPLRVREVVLEPSGPDEYWVNNRRYSAEEVRQAKEKRTGRLADDLRREGQTEDWMIEAMVRSLEMVRAGRAHDLRINGEPIEADYLYVPVAKDQYRNLASTLRCAEPDPPELAYALLARDSAVEKPPVPYVADVTGLCFDGSCPGKVWKAREVLSVYDQPGGAGRETARLAVGESVRPLHTRAYVTPVRARVVWDHRRFLQGDVFYLLDGQGEGFYRVWHYGEVVIEDLSNASKLVDSTARCEVPSKRCWAEFADYPREKLWARVRRASGQAGWVVADDRHFDGMFE
jgi:hypothetical protein